MKTVIGFHRPEEINGSFSNWYLSDFVVDGIKYSSMEQYMIQRLHHKYSALQIPEK